jgi:hypothetical protein
MRIHLPTPCCICDIRIDVLRGYGLGLLAAILGTQLAISNAQAASAPDAPDCRREIFFTDGAMVASQRRLQDNAAAKPAELCTIWRGHAGMLKKAVESYQRCALPQERPAKLAPAQTSLAEFESVIRSRCK